MAQSTAVFPKASAVCRILFALFQPKDAANGKSLKTELKIIFMGVDVFNFLPLADLFRGSRL
jgi:hypothetical protein